MTEVAAAAETTEATDVAKPDLVRKVEAADTAKPVAEEAKTESPDESDNDAGADIDKENDATSANNAIESVKSASDDNNNADASESADNQKVNDENEEADP